MKAAYWQRPTHRQIQAATARVTPALAAKFSGGGGLEFPASMKAPGATGRGRDVAGPGAVKEAARVRMLDVGVK